MKFLIMNDSIDIAYIFSKKVLQVYLKPIAFFQEETRHIYKTRFDREKNKFWVWCC